VVYKNLNGGYVGMKLKKILAALTSCALAVSATAAIGFTASAVDQVAGGLPAVFRDLEEGKTYDLSVVFEWGKAPEGNNSDYGNTKYIAIVGLSGSHDFTINSAYIGSITPSYTHSTAAGDGETDAWFPTDSLVAGQTYTLTVNLTSTGATGIRVRIASEDAWNNWTDDGAANSFEGAVPVEAPAVVAPPAAVSAITPLGAVTWINNDNQQGWRANGTDDEVTDLSLDALKAAKYIVIEMAAPPSGGIQVAVQSDGDGWAWNQTDGIEAVGSAFIIDTSTLTGWDGLKSAPEFGKFLIGFWGGDGNETFANLQITNAYLAYDASQLPATGGGGAAAPAPGGTEVPKVGNVAVASIVTVMVLAGAAAVVTRKRK
jgi:hypothetical protein